MRRTLPFLPLLLLTLACASSGSVTGVTGVTSEASTEDFDVTIAQANTAMVMRNQSRTDIRFNITIANRTGEPYTIRRVTLQSMSGTTLRIPVSSREFDKTIEPGAKVQLPYWATAEVIGLSEERPPLAMRASIEATDASGAERNETFMARLNGRVQVQLRAGLTDRDFMTRTFETRMNPEYSTIVYGPYGLPW